MENYSAPSYVRHVPRGENMRLKYTTHIYLIIMRGFAPSEQHDRRMHSEAR